MLLRVAHWVRIPDKLPISTADGLDPFDYRGREDLTGDAPT
jgi:hypothetical protein